MTAPQSVQPLAVELGADSWNEFIDRTERWFTQVRVAQVAYRHLAEDVLGKLHEPHLRKYLEEVVQTARQHESQIDQLYRAIGRPVPEAGRLEQLNGAALTRGREMLAGVESLLGGAERWWEELNQLFLASLDALSAFAAAEQLGFALGIKEIVDITFPIGLEKFRQHRMLQEITLELVPHAVLYRTGV